MTVDHQGQDLDRAGRSAPGISVITATVGRTEFLRAKIDALARQTLQAERWEWIVAFDGAGAPAEDVVRDSVPPEMQVRTVTTEGVGAGPARDAASRLARFSVLYLSDDDCLPNPDTLARHLDAQRTPGVYVGAIVFRNDDESTEVELPPARPGWWNVNGANTSVPSDAFRDVGGFGTAVEGYGGEDVWLGWRLVERGLSVRSLPEAVVEHLGSNPMRVASVERAASAGKNAVRLGRLEPRLRWRLGVHPFLLAIKLALIKLAPPSFEARLRGERAYSNGAWAELKSGRGTTS